MAHCEERLDNPPSLLAEPSHLQVPPGGWGAFCQVSFKMSLRNVSSSAELMLPAALSTEHVAARGAPQNESKDPSYAAGR